MTFRHFSLLTALFGYFISIADNGYHYYIDLNHCDSNEIEVKLFTPDLDVDGKDFMFPAIVPGTYAVYNFGRFISGFHAFSADGKELAFDQKDVNTYKINQSSNLAYITYRVRDTWHTPLKPGENHDDIVFEPAGSNLEKGKNFFLNTHCFFGYFKGMTDRNFEIEVNKPEGFYASTGLSDIESSPGRDVIKVYDYHRLIDSPIMYCLPDTTFVEVGGARVLISVYSPNKKIKSDYVARNIAEILDAQRKYLGGKLPVNKYAFIIYLNDKPTLSGNSGALEHSYSSTYALPEMDTSYIGQTMRDVAAHEFFHIVTPLSIHSDEIGNFQFNEPLMSKHLWLYEGLTEYNAHHVQEMYGLIDISKFIEVIKEKMDEAVKQYNDSLSFTEMSQHVLEPKYHSQYNNVYAKGALINMCLDIMLRYYSNGTYGTQNLMRDLAKKYGKDRSFQDDSLFYEIEKITFPEIGAFLRDYVGGNKRLPFPQVFQMVGFQYDAKLIRNEISYGGFAMGFSTTTNRAVLFEAGSMDAFGKKMGFKDADEIVTFNKKSFTMDSYREILLSYLENSKEGDKLEVLVIRKNKKGKEKSKLLKGKVKKVQVTTLNSILPEENISRKQALARRGWLGLKEE